MKTDLLVTDLGFYLRATWSYNVVVIFMSFPSWAPHYRNLVNMAILQICHFRYSLFQSQKKLFVIVWRCFKKHFLPKICDESSYCHWVLPILEINIMLHWWHHYYLRLISSIWWTLHGLPVAQVLWIQPFYKKTHIIFLYFWLYNTDIISANKIIQKWVTMPEGVSTGQIYWAHIFFLQI